MDYKITKDFIMHNRPRTQLRAHGIIIHNTDNLGDSAIANKNYFDTESAKASAHFIIDADTIIQCIPTNETAWHAGPTANSLYIGVELCTTNDSKWFNEIWKRAVYLFAKVFKELDIRSINSFNLRSHASTSNEYQETDHQDPLAYFQQFGVNMELFRKAVQDCINGNDIQDIIKGEIKKMSTDNTPAIPEYKVDGAQYLVDAGLTTSLHEPLEPVDIGTLGTILRNLQKKQ